MNLICSIEKNISKYSLFSKKLKIFSIIGAEMWNKLHLTEHIEANFSNSYQQRKIVYIITIKKTSQI